MPPPLRTRNAQEVFKEKNHFEGRLCSTQTFTPFTLSSPFSSYFRILNFLVCSTPASRNTKFFHSPPRRENCLVYTTNNDSAETNYRYERRKSGIGHRREKHWQIFRAIITQFLSSSSLHTIVKIDYSNLSNLFIFISLVS